MARLHQTFSLVLALLLPTSSALSGGTDCVVYATEYANSYANDNLLGDTVSGGMAGAVAGGEWEGQSGAERGARVGGALGVLNNLGSLPGGWQALYDTAYQLCVQGKTISNQPIPGAGHIRNHCGSSARYNAPMRAPGTGGISAGSARPGCP